MQAELHRIKSYIMLKIKFLQVTIVIQFGDHCNVRIIQIIVIVIVVVDEDMISQLYLQLTYCTAPKIQPMQR